MAPLLTQFVTWRTDEKLKKSIWRAWGVRNLFMSWCSSEANNLAAMSCQLSVLAHFQDVQCVKRYLFPSITGEVRSEQGSFCFFQCQWLSRSVALTLTVAVSVSACDWLIIKFMANHNSSNVLLKEIMYEVYCYLQEQCMQYIQSMRNVTEKRRHYDWLSVSKTKL